MIINNKTTAKIIYIVHIVHNVTGFGEETGDGKGTGDGDIFASST